MPAYKQLIYGVTIMLVGGAAYYFHVAGVPDLIFNGSDDKRGSGVSAAAAFSGTFICDETSGCKNQIKLILEDDTTLDIVATIDGVDSSLGQGSWDVNPSGGISMKIHNPSSTDPDYPTSITASKVSSIKIAGFSSKSLLPGMETPVFKRIKSEADIQAEQHAVAATPAPQGEESAP